MQDKVERAIHVDVVGHVVVDQLELRVADEMGDIFGSAGEKIIHADDLVTLGDHQVAHVRSEETGTAGDEHAH